MPPHYDKEKAFFNIPAEKGFWKHFDKGANCLNWGVFYAVGRFSNVANPSSSAGSS